MSELLAFIGLTVLLIGGTVVWKVLMKPTSPVWGDWAVGVELMVTASGVVASALLTEKTSHAAARLLLLCALGAVTLIVAVVMKVSGYDDAGEMTENGMKGLSSTGAVSLAVAYFVNAHVAGAVTLWHRLFG